MNDCPEKKRIGEDFVYCKLEETSCWQEHGYHCETWEEIQKEETDGTDLQEED